MSAIDVIAKDVRGSSWFDTAKAVTTEVNLHIKKKTPFGGMGEKFGSIGSQCEMPRLYLQLGLLEGRHTVAACCLLIELLNDHAKISISNPFRLERQKVSKKRDEAARVAIIVYPGLNARTPPTRAPRAICRTAVRSR